MINGKLRNYPLLLDFLKNFDEIVQGSRGNEEGGRAAHPKEFTQECMSIIKETISKVVCDEVELFKFAYHLRKVDEKVRNNLTTVLLKEALEQNG